MLRNEKGITLIALIITIIVMLILVGVTINVALNGGLFTKAEEAKTQTQKETDQEELQLAVVAALNDNLEIPDANAIKNNLSEGWTVTGPENGVYTCISPKLNEFTVNKTDKKIAYEGISDEKTEEPKFYGVPYSLDAEGTAVFYFFKDGVALIKEENIWAGFVYTKNDNQLTMFGEAVIISEDYNAFSIGGDTFTKNENFMIDWNKDYAPVVVSYSVGYSGIGSDGFETTLSYNEIQEKGEYRTTIVIADGKYSVTDLNVKFTLTGEVSSREYIEGQDYSYNNSTGEVVIFNLTEPVLMDISVGAKQY